MLVWDELALLNRCRQKPERVRRLVGIFLDDTPKIVQAMQTQVEASDFEGLHGSAHALKGIAANLGGLRLQERAFALETASRSNDAAACAVQLNTLKSEFEALLEELNDYLEE